MTLTLFIDVTHAPRGYNNIMLLESLVAWDTWDGFKRSVRDDEIHEYIEIPKSTIDYIYPEETEIKVKANNPYLIVPPLYLSLDRYKLKQYKRTRTYHKREPNKWSSYYNCTVR